MKNASIKFKIMFPITILAVLLLVSGIVSIVNLRGMLSAGQEISGNYAQSISKLGTIAEDFQALHRVIYAHCLSEDSAAKQELTTEANALREDIQSTNIECEEILNEGAEAESFAKFEASYEEYLTNFEKAVRLSNAGRAEEAAELANGTLTDLGDEITEEIDAMIQTNHDGMEAAIKRQSVTYHSSILIVVVLLVITAVVDICSILISRFYVSGPLRNINQKLGKIVEGVQAGHGDLTERISVDSRDEIGRIAVGINVFLETLQEIMGQISSSSVKLEDIVGTVANRVAAANDSSSDISAVMQELAASMEEISSTLSNISDHATTVDEDIVELAKASGDLLGYAGEMQTRAERLENTAVDTQKNTRSVVDDIITRLEKAIAESRSVEKVNELTDEILSISSQTNLLALNAAIEAARAGEAGKGFAVVADEISNLASESREAANNIQNINKMVVQAVADLTEQSNAVIRYVNENISKDYDGFVASGAQYKNDAVHVNEIVAHFNDMTTDIQTLVANITQSIQGIASAVDESASGVTSAAMNTTDLVQGIGQIATQMDDNQSIAEKLNEEAKRFDRV